jgi:hypothetical protein
MTDARHRNAVEAAERLADGVLTPDEFSAALQPVIGLWAQLSNIREGGPSSYMTGATRHLEDTGCVPWVASFAARGSARATGSEDSSEWHTARQLEDGAQCQLLHDIFGNPFRPVAVDPRWLAWNFGTVPAIARHVYEERAFYDLPILADALEDAGCGDAAILDHCRSRGPHVRGCWVVDLLLGKT